MALTVTAFETTNWTTTTTPLTISVTGALTGDQIVVIYGGDNGTGTGAVSAATVSTTGGSTGSWTEPQEGLATDNQAWISSSTAAVTADGTVTVSMARTQSTGKLWGGMALLVRGHNGIGNSARSAPSAAETVSLTVSEGSAVGVLAIDWDALAVVAFSPSGSTEVERSQQGAGPDLTYYAGYWLNQAAGTRGYGIGTSSTTNLHIIAVEVLAGASSSTVLLQQWPTVNLVGGPWPRTQLAIPPFVPAVLADDPPAIPSLVVRALEAAPVLPFVSVFRTDIDADTPARPTVVGAQPVPTQSPFVSLPAARTDPVAVAPDTPPRPTVAAAVQPVQALPYVNISDTRVDPVAAPDVAVRPMVAAAQQPAFALPYIQVLRTAVGDTIPTRATVAPAAPLPPVPPFVYISGTRADQPAAPDTPARPTVARAVELPPVSGTVFVDQTLAEPPTAPAATPPRPIVQTGQPVPPPAGWSTVSRTPADPVAVVSGGVPRPTVVTVTSVPAPGTVFVARPVAGDQPSSTRPVIATSTVKPPEIASAVVSRTWGPPPPILRRPATPIVVDISMPPPYGTATVRRGFAESIPVLGAVDGYAVAGTAVSGPVAGNGSAAFGATSIRGTAVQLASAVAGTQVGALGYPGYGDAYGGSAVPTPAAGRGTAVSGVQAGAGTAGS